MKRILFDFALLLVIILTSCATTNTTTEPEMARVTGWNWYQKIEISRQSQLVQKDFVSNIPADSNPFDCEKIKNKTGEKEKFCKYKVWGQSLKYEEYGGENSTPYLTTNVWQSPNGVRTERIVEAQYTVKLTSETFGKFNLNLSLDDFLKLQLNQRVKLKLKNGSPVGIETGG